MDTVEAVSLARGLGHLLKLRRQVMAFAALAWLGVVLLGIVFALIVTFKGRCPWVGP